MTLGATTTEYRPQTMQPSATPLSGAPGPTGGAVPGAVGGSGPTITDFNAFNSLFQAANAPQQVLTDQRIANLQNSLALSFGQADLARSGIQQDQGFNRQRLDLQRALLGDQGQELGARRGDIDYWHNRQSQNFLGGQAARGATHTTGTTRGLQDFETERARLMRSLGMDERQLNRAKTNLGIDEQEMGTRVQRTLEQLGLDQALGVNDIFNAIIDAEAGRFNPISQLLGEIYKLSGIRPTTQSTTTTTQNPIPVRGGGGGGGMKVM